MEALLQFGLANAASAALLAVVVAVVTRFWRNPYLAHVLWVIVLMRLVAPPVFQISFRTPEWFARQPAAIQPPTLPEVVKLEPADVSPAKHADSAPASTPAAVPDGDLIGASHDPPAPLTAPPGRVAPTTETPASPIAQPSFARSLQLFDVLAGVWIAGTVLYVAITTVRVRSFARALQRSQCAAAGRLEEVIGDIAQSIGLRRVPRLMVVDAPLPPMVWSGWRPKVLVPQRIVESIDPSQRRLLLLHELLHIRHGDHLVRWLAVAVLALYWWNPFAWWTVRRLQNAEEECCDAAVLFFHPHDCEIYGEALLAVSEFVSCGSLPAAAVSVGVERKKHLKRRMTMILSGSRWPKLTRAPLASLIACAVIVVGVSLRIAAAQVEPAADAKSAPVAEPPKPQTAPEKSHATVPTPFVAPDQSARPTTNRHGETDRLPELLAASPLKATPEDDDVRKLLKERYNVALLSLHSTFGAALTDSLPRNTAMLGIAASTLLDADLALAAPNDTHAVYERYLELTNFLDRRAEGLLKAKVIGQAEYEAARERRMDAEKKLRRELASRQHAGQEATKTGSAWAPPPPAGSPAAASAKSLPAWMTAQPVGRAGDDELHKLLEDRYNSALKSLHAHLAKIEIDSNIPAMPVVAAARTLLDAELAITAAADVLSVYPRYVQFLRYFDDLIGKRWATKTIGADEFNAVHEARLDAEIKLRSHHVLRASPAWLTAKALESASGDDELRKLLKERYNSALKTLHALLAQIEIDSNVRMRPLLAAARTLRDDELAVAASRADARGVYQRYAEFLGYVGELPNRHAFATGKFLGADEINALVDAQKGAESMRRSFSGQKSPTQSAPSTTEGTKSLPAAQAAVIASEPLPELLKAKPLEPATATDDVHSQLKGRYDSAFKSLQLQFEGECRKCHSNAAKELWHRAADIRIGQGGGEPAPEKRTGGKIQSLKLRVRIAEGEVNAARAVVDQTEAELKRVLSNLKYRQAQLDRIQLARKQYAGSISDSGLEEAIRARDDAAAGVEAAKATIRAAQAQVEIKGAQLEQVHLELKQAASEGK
jgi:beta-lactamase regulating signal transducer with metallopeptidase domain